MSPSAPVPAPDPGNSPPEKWTRDDLKSGEEPSQAELDQILREGTGRVVS